MARKLTNKENEKIKNVKILYESAKLCPISNKYSPQFNYWTSYETLKSILECIDKKYNYIICERGAFDTLCWMTTYFLDKKITEEQYKTLINLYSSFDWTDILKYILLVKCSTHAALSRETTNDLIRKHGSIVNSTIITKYNNSFDLALNQFKNKNCSYSIIDTTNMTNNESNIKICSSILEFIKHIRPVNN